MEYREYGKTGKLISVIGFGGTRLPFEKGIETCAEIVVKAFENGINIFDAGFDYSGGMCEQIYREAFKQIRGKFYISAKSRYYNDPDESSVRRRIENSLKTMGVDKLDFYHMWAVMDLEQHNKIIEPGGPYDGAMKAKEEGLIDHICISAHCSGEEIEKIVNDDKYEGIIIGYNLLNHSFRQRGLDAAVESGIGILIMNPLAGGILPRNETYFKRKSGINSSIIDASFRFILSNRGVTSILSGISNENELIENIAIINNRTFNRTDAVYDLLDQINDLCTGCDYCKGCPSGIPISRLMQAYNQKIIENDSEAILANLEKMWRYERTREYPCVACGICEKKCTQHLPIISRIRSINELTSDYRCRFVDLFGNDKEVAIYGMGEVFLHFYEEYKNCGLKTELYMFDGNQSKWGNEIVPGHVIRNPSEIVNRGIKKVIVTTASQNAFNSINVTLKKLDNELQVVKYGGKVEL